MFAYDKYKQQSWMRAKMKAIALNRLVSGLLLAFGTYGLAQADTTYTYSYNYNWSVPNSGANDCSTGSWLSSCTLSGGSRVPSLGNPVTPTDPNAPPTTITSTATGWADTANPNDDKIAQGAVQSWGGGLGVRSGDESSNPSAPNHATDNEDDWEVILYEFGSKIALNSVSTSYDDYDTDIIVLAYDTTAGGAWNLDTKLKGQTYSQLVNLGWKLIDNYQDLVANNSKAINAGGFSSSYWLIGAANTQVVGGTNETTGAGIKDYVKLYQLAGTITTTNTVHTPPPPGVPEPGSLLLLGLGSLLLVRARVKQG